MGPQFSQLQRLQDGEQHRRRDHSSSAFDPSQPPGSESSPSTTDSPQSRPAESSSATRDESSSSHVVTSRTADKKPSSTRRSAPITRTTGTSMTVPSAARTTITLTENASSTTNLIDITPAAASATASAIPKSDEKPFQMSAGAIVAAVVLCCFFCGGAVIMLYYRTRRRIAWRKGHQQSSLTTDSEHGPEPKLLGDSLISSKMLSRESIMFHPDHRQSGSAASMNRKGPYQNLTEQEPPPDYHTECTDIAMNDIEPSEEYVRSPVSPLLPPTYPRPISNNSGRSERHSLRREFSFEKRTEPSQVPPAESRLSRRSALSSNPSSDWPIAMPNYYSSIPAQPASGYQLAPSDRRSSGGGHAVVPRQSFEDVQLRVGR
ncbi:hypothetical protein EPUS_06000 [Endocarpon pusillum Z07020]|uniref:Uncharacterized protein n=1 Tax=Endocarpon pusillum (strain Z07020 / HMAS-L-300199) TaxID=1263415 RepID=U1GHB8_ENDPU|nr:uncharacterized protein EPUS_06000 [Endocarpon pusillum Z07020]ERF71171.1 hypothetical protein EPUS_06000 [Endocarpon pusillum Z07020]